MEGRAVEKGQVVDHYFNSVDELAQHEKPVLHCAEKALLEMLEEGKRPAV